jgi:penicillin-binding protein 1A
MGVAGKTGTTDNYIDRWFCGFTPYYAAACWYGNDANNAAFGNNCNGGGNPAGQIWFRVMQKVDDGLEKKDFDKPEGIVSRRICKDSGKIATDSCSNTYSEIFNKDSLPGTCTGHSSCEVCKESGKLATEFCGERETKVFGVKLDTEENAKWSPKQEVTTAPTEKCDIHVSAPEISVPNVVGKMQAQAEQELKKAGFEVDSSKKGQDKSKPKGAVLKQSATSAPKGSTIVITINTYSGSDTPPSTNTTPANETSHNTVTNTTKPPKPDDDDS